MILFFFFFLLPTAKTRICPRTYSNIYFVISSDGLWLCTGYTNAEQAEGQVSGELCGGSSWSGSLPVSRLLPPQSARTGGCSASLAIVDGLNEFQRRGELHPPIALLPTQPAGVEIIDVLNGGQQAGRVCLEGRRRGGGGVGVGEGAALEAPRAKHSTDYSHKYGNV